MNISVILTRNKAFMIYLIVKTALRSFRRNTFYHLISIAMLSLAFAVTFFILVWINHETSYDRMHPSGKRLYRLTWEYNFHDYHSHFARSYQDWVLYLKDYFPEVEEVVRLAPMRNVSVHIGDAKFYNSSFFRTDSSFFKLFGFGLIHGDPGKVLSEPGSAVISKSIARKYFGDGNPIGQTISAAPQFDTIFNQYTVTGVMKDFPSNTHFHISILVPVDDPEKHIGWSYNYLLLRERTDPGEIIAKFPAFLKEHLPAEEISYWIPHLQLVRDIHLYSDKDREIEPNGKAFYLIVFSLVALLLLGIAVINYADLQIIVINRKIRFIFLNRIAGARMRDILKFIVFENGVNNIAAVIIGILLLIPGTPVIDRLFGYQLTPDWHHNWIQYVILAFLLILTGIMAGTVPVLLIHARDKLYEVGGRLFGRQRFIGIKGANSPRARIGIVIIQFLISLVMVFSTLIIYIQVDYMLKAGIGSGDSSILVLQNLPEPVLGKYMLFKQELLVNPLIREVSASMEAPATDVMDAMKFEMEGMNSTQQEQLLNVLPVDDNFLDFYRIPLLGGSNFPHYRGMEGPEHYIINETALKKLGFRTPGEAVGRKFKLIFSEPGIFRGGQIIGVCQDFHFYTLAKQVKPIVLFQKHIWFWCFLVKVDRQHMHEAIDYLNQTWTRIYPDYPFEYHFVDDLYASLYKNEITQARILVLGTLLTVLIACLGLIVLLAYWMETRTKEIAIRKVSGATTLEIIYWSGSRILLWILVSMAFAMPLSWWIVDKYWLLNFTYISTIHWSVFILTGLSVIMLASLVIIIQSFKAASRNPSNSLRYE